MTLLNDSWIRDYQGPWIATFRDGPLADHRHDRIFSVGPVWDEMWLAPVGDVGIHGWTIVGGPGWEPDVPHGPEQARYRVVQVIEMDAAPHAAEPVAYYEIVEMYAADH